jgi:thiaminase
MPQTHSSTFVASKPTDGPCNLTTHLLSVNYEQLQRIIHHRFLARAANGSLPKSLVEQWLANDLQYLKIYKGLSAHTLVIFRNQRSEAALSNAEEQLARWLEAAVPNGTREEFLFEDVANRYGFNIAITDATKNEGLRRYEALYSTLTSATNTDSNSYLPWLEGAVTLWAMERIYYEAWSWAASQDTQSDPRSYEKDMDGGAMRKEFIPNWASKEFAAFVGELERAVDDEVGEVTVEVRQRAEKVWKAVLDAEEAFWPDVLEV